MTAMSFFQKTTTDFTSRWEPGPWRARSFWLGLAIVAAAFVVGAVVSWDKNADPLDDFGTQLYVPWKLSTGGALYRDVFYFSGGPLSQYFNALLYQVFGVSLTTILVANLVFIALLLLVIYRLFFMVADAWTAATIGVAIVLVFAFAQYDIGGNMNYVTPYSEDAVHGLFLAVVSVGLFADWVRTGRLRSAAAAGLGSGLVFLTKPDIFLALAACAFTALALLYLNNDRRRFLKASGLFAAAFLIPLVGFFLYFLRVENPHDSLRSTVFAWVPVFNHAVVNSALYQWCMGLDAPGENLVQMLSEFALVICSTVLLYHYVANWRVLAAKLQSFRPQIGALFLLSTPLLIVTSVTFSYDWHRSAASLPLLMLSACAWLAVLSWRRLHRDLVFPLLWTVFSLVLLWKLGLFSRLWHYGFVLAMPATAALIYFLLWLLPQQLKKGRVDFPWLYFRAIFCLVFLIASIRLFGRTADTYATETIELNAGYDTIKTLEVRTQSGKAMQNALRWIKTNIPPEATLSALPEGGGMVNFLSRRANPNPCVFWDPYIMATYSEETMTRAFLQHPPDYLLFVEWHAFKHGYIGKDGGEELMAWIGKNYEAVHLSGAEPFKNGAYGIKILKRLPVPSVSEVPVPNKN